MSTQPPSVWPHSQALPVITGASRTPPPSARYRRRSWRNNATHDRSENLAPRVLLLLLARIRGRTLSLLRRRTPLCVVHRRLVLDGRHRRRRRRRPGIIILDDERTPRPPDDWIQPGHIAFAPIAICFQFTPSEIATHGTAPVPPALK